MHTSLRPRVLALAIASLLAACGPGANPEQEQLARELAAASFAKDSRAEALVALKPLIERSDAQPSDLIDAACVHLRLGDSASAAKLLERAASASASDPRYFYNRGRIAQFNADLEAAAKDFRRVLELAPDDLPTRFKLIDSVQGSDPAEYERLLREIVARGIENAGSWYLPAIYKLGLHCTMTEREAEGEKLLDEHQSLGNRGVPSPRTDDFDMGNFGRIAFPTPRGSRFTGTGALASFGAPATILPEFAGARGVQACDLDNDGDLDLVGWGERGLVLGLSEQGTWRAISLAQQPVELALAFDLDGPKGDNVLDLLYVAQGELRLVRSARSIADKSVSWSASAKSLPRPAGSIADGLAIDYDHEGDLDVLLVGSAGAQLLRNDGLASENADGKLTDVTAEAKLPTGSALTWCVAEDFDTDQDVDLLLGREGAHFLATNLRGGVFADASSELAGLVAPARRPLVADLDGDSRPDVWSGDGVILRAQLGGGWKADGKVTAPSGTLPGNQPLFALDLDLDGSLDALWPGADAARLQGHLALGTSATRPTELALAAAPALLEDLDGDLAWDALAITPAGLSLQRGQKGNNNALRLGFRGVKDNRRGVGAIVELRAQETYRRVFWRGEATLLGVGTHKETDLVRVTWPNGVIQYELRRDLGDRASTGSLLEQSEGLVGSCPFLYSWNGREYVFVSDVLGITPLGLPMAPGMLVPPDHDEYVLVTGEQLVPKDGFLELQFTEELREVTYLDRIRVDVVDHPEGTEIYPNELFTFPPFPAPHTHTARAPLAPAAQGSDGRDWSVELASIDDRYAAPFEPAPGQFLGLANPHFLELSWDKAALAGASKLRLVMTGWFYWTDASVNMASARDPEQEFIPPMLQVPDGQGGWRMAGPPIGFPAGKTKSMVVDVTALLDRENPRLRLFGSLRLYWDSIRLATDNDDAPLEVTALEPSGAKLWLRGFSDPERSELAHQPERFDWERIAWQPRWNAHPGSYTKLGDVLPLLGAIDDRFVIMGSGDALSVRFDARALPAPKAGWRRDYLVFLDGWAKDRDPNTVDALYVEPLPFHGMSAYPYGANESFPKDAEHEAWRREWNTRPAQRWIAPVHAGEPLPRSAPR